MARAARQTLWGGWALLLVQCSPQPRPPAQNEPAASQAAKAPAPSPRQGCPSGMLQVAAGSFSKGKANQPGASPPFQVSFSQPYCIDRTEVTVAEYAQCVNAG